MKQLLTILLTSLITIVAFLGIQTLFLKKDYSKLSTGDYSNLISVTTQKEVVHDTLLYHPPSTAKVTDSIPAATPLVVDTQAILKQYYNKYAYADTLSDTNLVMILIDTVSRNKIISRKSSYRILRPQLLQTTTTVQRVEAQPRKAAFYGGAFLSLSGNGISAGPEIMLIKEKHAYALGYDLNTKAFMGQMAWRISK